MEERKRERTVRVRGKRREKENRGDTEKDTMTYRIDDATESLKDEHWRQDVLHRVLLHRLYAYCHEVSGLRLGAGGHVLEELQEPLLGVVDELGALDDELAEGQIAVQDNTHQSALVVLLQVLRFQEGGKKI